MKYAQRIRNRLAAGPTHSARFDCADIAAEADAEIEQLKFTVEEQEKELMRTWFVLKEFNAHPGRTMDRLSDCVRLALEGRK